jgi:energy-coupling factor transporter ATP-binding protein EcfA2
VHDYQLEELSPRGFEQLTVTLVRKVVGPGLAVYGSGPDGGREAAFTGRIDWAASGDDDQAWTGYTVVQAKQRERPSDTDLQNNVRWLKLVVRKEIDAWMDPDSPRRRFPNNLLFVTNVRLSSAAGTGGIDQMEEFFRECLDRKYAANRISTPRVRGLRSIKLWHRDDLNAAITEDASIRHAFPGMLTAGDVLARIEVLASEQRLPNVISPALFATVLTDHAQTTLRTQRWMRFDEAGDDDNKMSIDRVIVNLPARSQRGDRTTILGPILARGDDVLRKSVWLADAPNERKPPRHLVITGAPGNGKSTLAKYLVQVYRAAFIGRETDEQPTITNIIESTTASLTRLNVSAPVSRRWPLRVDLAPMAEAMGPGDGGLTLRRWLCRLINESANVDVNPATLDDWLKSWPSLIVFDGLDEVTHFSLRQRVIHEITALVERADASDADLLIVVTTRPTGYSERLWPEHFEQIDLDYLQPKEAEAYGHHVTQQKYADDPERQAIVLSAFKAALSNPGSERLIKTPLQVLILTVIVASSGALPANRYLLFWTYYETVFRREANKPTTHRNFFTNHRDDITELHQQVGLLLQIQCETTAETRGRMPLDELRELAKERLLAVGHRIERADELAARMVEVATKRLVLLAPDEDDTVAFDVRSLQELMAGCALLDGGDELIRHNLTVTAAGPHWRNTWLFAAGRLFAGGDHHRRLVLDIVARCDREGPWPGWLYRAAPELAADMLDDGLAATRPNDQRSLIDIALRCLRGPLPQDPRAVALGLRAAISNGQSNIDLRAQLQDAMKSGGVARSVAANLWQYGRAFGSAIPGLEHELSREVDRWRFRHATGARSKVGQLLRDSLSDAGGGDDFAAHTLVDAALRECDQLTLRRTASGDLWPDTSGKSFTCPALQAALADDEAALVLELAVEGLRPEDWAAWSLLARAYWPTAARRPVGAILRCS